MTDKLLRANATLLMRNYRRTVLGASLLLAVALLVSTTLVLSNRQNALLADTRHESQQLKLSLEATVDLVREHLFTMRRTVEYGLTQPSAGDAKAGSAHSEMGTLHRDPKADIDPKLLQRDLAAAARFLVGATATHQWNPIFQWSYYYDKGERWFLIYPKLPIEAITRAAKTDDPSAAIRFFFDADGTRPVAMVGPGNNPKREMLWTPPYHDAAGKGMMVTLLAPVYLGDEYVGSLGTDVTLKALRDTLRAHAPVIGRALVVDGASNVLADTGPSLDKVDGRVQLTRVFPELPSGIDSIDPADPAWLRYPLKGTSWFLIVRVPHQQLRANALAEQAPYLAMAALMFVALFVIGWLQSRRYAWPALQLAEYVQRRDGTNDAEPPPVSEAWAPIFDQVTRVNRERHELLQQTQANADELEHKVAERTAQLQAANASLQDTVASLRQTRRELVRADRMGALGGMIAGVANELEGPLDQAARTARHFHAGIAAFKEQQARGLRKSELEAFVAEADATGRQVSEEVGAAVTLLGRFKQLALDQASEQARQLHLREIVENLLAVMRPALALHGGTVDSRIDADLEMTADAGRLGQILHHLLADAIERIATIGTSGRLELVAGLANDTQGEGILLTLSDNGIPPASSAQAGQAFATALVQEITGASLDARLANGGSRIELKLPRHAA